MLEFKTVNKLKFLRGGMINIWKPYYNVKTCVRHLEKEIS